MSPDPSAVLRRLLIDNGGDLRKVSPPRLGRRLHLTAPDLAPIYKEGAKAPWEFMSAGVAHTFGILVDAWSVNKGGKAREIEGFEPEKNIQLPLDSFISQRIICFKGEWFTRRDAVTYIANVAHGVHAGDPKEPKHEKLKKIRHIATIKFATPPGSPPATASMPMLIFDIDAFVKDEAPIKVDRSALDFVLVQLMATARYLTNSPDLDELEKIIRAEPQP